MRVTDRLKQSCLFTGLALSLSFIPVGVQQNARAAVSKPAALQPSSMRESVGAGKTCISDDPDYLCLGVKYVVYVDPSSKQPVVSPAAAQNNFTTINSIWNQCKIGFQIDELVLKTPESAGLPTDTADFSDLDRIRQTFNEDSSFLIVTTYKWKRDSGLGHTPANAWTKMPGSGLYGVIMEQKVGTFPNIIAHELGHYLNLYHANENKEVMNAIIYNNSNLITQDQCSTARAAVKKWWPNMVRRLPPVVPAAPQLANGQAEKTKKS